MLKTGQSRFGNQVDWARFYLAKAGYLDSSKRGVWTLTPRGAAVRLRADEAINLFKNVHRGFVADSAVAGIGVQSKDEREDVDEDEVTPVEERHRSELLEILTNKLSPGGFERLCQRLLREEGFEQVEITGRAGDGGIDGYGVLKMNSLVSFKVIFQCKRYRGTVTPTQVRDFRGAMVGRADKDIIMTTGGFTAAARAEAVRDGVGEINLIDGEALIERFEELQLGLVPKTVYEIDSSFFEEYFK